MIALTLLVLPLISTAIDVRAEVFPISCSDEVTSYYGESHASTQEYEIPGCDYPVRKIRFICRGDVSDIIATSKAIDSIEISDFDDERMQLAYLTTDAVGFFDTSGITGEPLNFQGQPRTAIAGTLELDEITVVDIWVSLYTYDSAECRLWYYNDVSVEITGAAVELCEESRLAQQALFESISRSISDTRAVPDDDSLSHTSFSPASFSAEYIIITSAYLAEAFRPLIKWKRQLGYSAEIVTTEDIYSQSSGVDNPERIRNYLIDAYDGGTRWVLLGGDETVVPIRYAFHLDRSTDIALDMQQVCDLYYADLTGEWDADGDGIYGEMYDDSPDITPEIMIGRVPVDTPTEVAAFIEKSIAYERNPGDGDDQFALKLLTAASDQMRDYHDIGQDSMLAEQLPAYLDVDTWSLAEAPSGSDESPASPAAVDFISKLSEGFNLAYIFAHGMANGFVSRAAAYNEWPKSFVLTAETAPPGHATMCDATNSNRCGIIYSVGCNNGAFDMDVPPYENTDPCVAERLLTQPQAGAAAFIGYSRWGWVASSYRFAIDFNECIFNLDNRLAPANNYSKANNHTIRDLVYGLNVYGDPSLRIWTDIPQQVSTAFPTELDFGENSFSLDVNSIGDPIDSAQVTVVGKEAIIFDGFTGSDGVIEVAFTLTVDTTVTVTVSKPGYVPIEENLSPSLLLDADDDTDDLLLPSAFSLKQNYPNPFNPTTKIAFDLPRATYVELGIYNVLGQLEETLLSEQMGAGAHITQFDAAGWPSGVYFYRLKTDMFSDAKKMVILK
ncbi:MAG: T9SS type A sorting domain-containing protein [candidate division Zixibacteria bacterium]|nr:T9SS type A sorting domain-containing protein [candidate division Zixibacteria bacterium]MBU1469430.1 T9SS type A sorting domain-containing protein [candidate division Zixibacteria bacterium]MBU2624184.1 T9SS type A sorting domain-containing protein [candidate division Zixibacteria bacterium]